jgi:hypothetical protein
MHPYDYAVGVLRDGVLSTTFTPRGAVIPCDWSDSPCVTLHWNVTKSTMPKVTDLVVDCEGICGTLFFQGRPFWCKVPWACVTGMGNAALKLSSPQGGLYSKEVRCEQART